MQERTLKEKKFLFFKQNNSSTRVLTKILQAKARHIVYCSFSTFFSLYFILLFFAGIREEKDNRKKNACIKYEHRALLQACKTFLFPFRGSKKKIK